MSREFGVQCDARMLDIASLTLTNRSHLVSAVVVESARITVFWSNLVTQRPMSEGHPPQGSSAQMEIGRLGPADFFGSVLDCRVDIVCVHVQLFGDRFLCVEFNGVQALLQGAAADDEERGLSVVDDLAEFLGVRAGQPLPEVTAHSSDGGADNGRGDEG